MRVFFLKKKFNFSTELTNSLSMATQTFNFTEKLVYTSISYIIVANIKKRYMNSKIVSRGFYYNVV